MAMEYKLRVEGSWDEIVDFLKISRYTIKKYFDNVEFDDEDINDIVKDKSLFPKKNESYYDFKDRIIFSVVGSGFLSFFVKLYTRNGLPVKQKLVSGSNILRINSILKEDSLDLILQVNGEFEEKGLFVAQELSNYLDSNDKLDYNFNSFAKFV